ncbi:CBS domain-containing protein [Deltaproteobacteria bacterium TL4]
MALVKSIMKKNLVISEPDSTVMEAIQKMGEQKIGTVLIVEDGKLLGIFSERDLLMRVMVQHKNPETTLLKEVYTSNPITVSENTPVKECVQLLRKHGFRHLPVTNHKGKVIGIISSRDFFQYILIEVERLMAKEELLLKCVEGDDLYDYIGEDYDDPYMDDLHMK